MCSANEVRNIVDSSNKNMMVHIEYIKKTLKENKGEHREIMDKFEAYIDKAEKNTATNRRVDDLEKKIEKLEGIVSKAIFSAIFAVISNLVTVIYFLLNHFL